MTVPSRHPVGFCLIASDCCSLFLWIATLTRASLTCLLHAPPPSAADMGLLRAVCPSHQAQICAGLECPHDCLGRGICVEGECQCHLGFEGLYCQGVLGGVDLTSQLGKPGDRRAVRGP